MWEFIDYRIAAAAGWCSGFLGLLIAFTFSGAATRPEARWHLIAEEANGGGRRR